MPDAPGAEHLVVVLDDGRAAHVRAADARVEPVVRYDVTRSLGHVTLDGAPATLLELPAGDTAAAWFIAQSLLAAEAIGAVEVALQVSVAYAKERHTFGRAIGSYQAVKHELVEILRRLDNARSLMYYAGWAAQDKPEEFPLAASAFRLAAGKAFDHATRTQISVHGGIGATWEHDAPLYFRRAQLSRRLLGGDGRRRRPRGRRAPDQRARGGGLTVEPVGRDPARDREQEGARDEPAAECGGLVLHARHDGAPAGDHALDAGARDVARVHRRGSRASGRAPSPAPATSANSVRVKPGDRHVTLTPVPASSACTDSENDCTNAFVAA